MIDTTVCLGTSAALKEVAEIHLVNIVVNSHYPVNNVALPAARGDQRGLIQ